jgi:DNA-directed RNA polymerase subunit beta'
MLRRLRKIAAKRDELIAKERAKTDGEPVLSGPADAAGPARRRRRMEDAAE